MDAARDVVAASIAGVSGIVAGQPFDTVKVRLQTQASGAGIAPQYTGPLDCARKILVKEGPLGFFKGMVSPIVANAPINALLFAVEGQTSKQLRRRGWSADSASTHALSGAVSGLSQTIIAGPSELVKIRLQCQVDAKAEGAAHGPWEVARRIASAEGVTGLLRGFGLTVARDVPAFSVYFTSYWYVKHWLSATFPWMRASRTRGRSPTPPVGADLGGAEAIVIAGGAGMGTVGDEDEGDGPMEYPGERGARHGTYWRSGSAGDGVHLPASMWGDHQWVRVWGSKEEQAPAPARSATAAAAQPHKRHKPGPIAQLLAGGVAGTASWFLLHPIDVLKSVVQQQTPQTPKAQAGAFRATVYHLKVDGPSFFLRGIVPTCLRAFPASAVIFLVYETIGPMLPF